VSYSDVVTGHRSAGREFEAAGTRSFVRDEGDGEVVLCMHGVPASSFTYRKVIAELAARDLRGVAFDLPGLGLAARPQQFDYSWSGLGRFSTAAVDALELGRFHLVVHDIGGPVGFEVAVAIPERIKSLTLLNTLVEVERFHRPWMMEPFAHRGVGELWLASMIKPVFRQLMYYAGVRDRSATPAAELDAYVDLLKREDGGRAFLKIMRGFERTAAKQRLYEGVVRDVPYPVQVVWGAVDPALKLSVYGEQARRATGLETVHTVPAKHFLQEDQAPAIAERVAALASSRPSSS
jgi:pimeloyl-ACP methyl ester carboxylesterase